MRTPVPEYLHQVMGECSRNDRGAVADYIPQLAQVDPDRFGLAITVTDGETYVIGDKQPFTIQSMAKPFVYALALSERGMRTVMERVGVDPSGDAFHKISLGEDGRPLNPMINVGAIVTHALVGGDDIDTYERFERVKAGLERFAGRELEIDEAVYESEFEHSFRNRALANMVRHYGIVQQDPRELVREYTRQSAINVTTRDLAVMGATLATGGVNPITGETVVEPWVAKQVLSVMLTCGMYDAAGDWMTQVGMPAKSGVSGGIMAALPGQGGIAIFSPKLDDSGTSVRAARAFRRLSRDMNMHLMDTAHIVDSPIRSRGTRIIDGEPASLFQLQGSLNFATMEFLLRQFEGIPDEGQLVVIDLSRVTTVNMVGEYMLAEGIRRLREDGHAVTVIDPDRDLRGTSTDADIVTVEPEEVRQAIADEPLLG